MAELEAEKEKYIKQKKSKDERRKDKKMDKIGKKRKHKDAKKEVEEGEIVEDEGDAKRKRLALYGV